MGLFRIRAARIPAPALLLVLLFGSVPAAHAAGIFDTFEGEGLRITIDGDWATQTAPGYIPIRFDITNATAARTIEIVERGSRFRSLSHTRPQVGTTSVVQRLRLARGSRINLTIPLPVSVQNETYAFEVREDGEVIHSFGSFSVQSAALPGKAAALMVVDGGSALARAAENWARPLYPGGAAGTPAIPGRLPAIDVLLHPSRLPTNWLGFSSVSAVLIGPSEWQELSDGQRTALRTWVACGGDLLLIDGDLAEWQPSAPSPGAVLAGATRVPYLLGRVHSFTSEQMTTAGFESTLMSLQSGNESNWALPANRAADWEGTFEHGFRMAMAGVGQIHARAYLLLLLLFAVLIGPVNFLVLWKRRRQALLVLTVPAIALAFILLLGGYVVAGEGFGVHARAVTMTLLDQGRQQAATRASVSMYAAGRSPRGGMVFSRDTVVIPSGGTDLTPALAVDLTDTQRIDGLVRARTPANFETVAFRSARERLVVHRLGDRIEVVNGLGETVKELSLRSGSVDYRLPSALGNGERRALVRTSIVKSPVSPTHPYFKRFSSLMQQPDESYVAVLTRSPFWQPGVASVTEHDSVHVVVGILEP